MIKLIKYSKGYVKIKVWGYSPERFMNLCSNRNILIWDVQHGKDCYIMNISIKGFFELKPILRKTRTKVAILKRYGLPFLIPKMKKRFIFICGIIGCILFLILMSNNLWAIEVVGNYTITTDKFMDFLKENEINYGMRKRAIDIEQLEKEIRLQFDIVTWTSVKLEGTKLCVQIKENALLKKEREKIFEVSNLIAEKEGTIVNMITRNGVPNVKVGAEIKKGDLLVSGKIPILGEDSAVRGYQYCNADADIYLQCIYPYYDKLRIEHTEKQFTGKEQKIFFIELFGKHLQLPHKKITYANYDIFTNKKQLKILDNFYLPIFTGSEIIREYSDVSKRYTKEEGKNILNENFMKFIADLKEKGVQIIQKDVKIETGKDLMVVSGKILVVELTGKSVETTKEMVEDAVDKEAGSDTGGVGLNGDELND